MAVETADLKWYMSGGSSNTTPDNSIGGGPSTEATGEITATPMRVFDKVTGPQSDDGHTDYRLVYVKNDHATLTLEDAKLYIEANTPDAGSHIEVGLAATAKGNAAAQTEPTIANETTAPAGVTFTQPTETGTGSAIPLDIDNLAAQNYKGIWIKRVIDSSNRAVDNETAQLAVDGDSAQ